MALDVVVFDVGNVLIQWDPRHLYRKLLDDDAEVERFLSEVCTPEWNLAQDLGRSWADGVDERVARYPDMAALIRAFDARWSEMVPGAIEPSVSVLRDLKSAGVPIYGLTNFSAEKWRETIARFEFFSLFDGVVVSAHEGVVKPEPAIYRVLLERYGLAAEDCIFVDDSAANIDGAQAMGIAGIHFTPGLDLRAALKERGVRGL